MSSSTIASIITGQGQSGIAIVALCGGDARSMAARLFRPRRPRDLDNAPDGTLLYGHVYDGDRLIDEALLAVRAVPRGQWCVEINCHGGTLPVRMTAEVLARQGVAVVPWRQFIERTAAGDRIARRAQVRMAAAKTPRAVRVLAAQAAGALRGDVRLIVDHLRSGRLKEAREAVRRLLRTENAGRVLTVGAKLCIVGAPNVGKSSLLNALVGSPRALVHHLPGTTRDVVSQEWSIRGIPMVFHDTAGLRETDDEIELEGVRLAHIAARDADLLLFVVDGSRPVELSRPELLARLDADRTIIVANKIDLPRRFEPREQFAKTGVALVETSAVSAEGLDALALAIDRALLGETPGFEGDAEEPVLFIEELAEELRGILRTLDDGVDSAEAAEALGRWLDEETRA